MKVLPSLAALAFLASALFPANNAHAGDGSLNIRVTLISCGPTIKKACKKDIRCCTLTDDGFEDADRVVDLPEIAPMTSIEKTTFAQTEGAHIYHGYVYHDLRSENPPVKLYKP